MNDDRCATVNDLYREAERMLARADRLELQIAQHRDAVRGSDGVTRRLAHEEAIALLENSSDHQRTSAAQIRHLADRLAAEFSKTDAIMPR